MKQLQYVGASVILCVLALGVMAADKVDNAKAVVGKWEVVKCDADSLPVGAIVEMTKDGKVKVSMKKDDTEIIHEGTYKVDGDKIMVTLVDGTEERKHSVTIKKVSDTELVTEHDGKTLEFKKKK
jgi:uncharacterized protein (TIGR03066 family)